MRTYKRISSRQGLIDACAKRLAYNFPGSTESAYRQNTWSVIDESLLGFVGRARYWQHTSALAKIRLFNEIARQAYIIDQSSHVTSNGYMLSVDRPKHWSVG